MTVKPILKNWPYLGLHGELQAQRGLDYHVICDSDPSPDRFCGVKSRQFVEILVQNFMYGGCMGGGVWGVWGEVWGENVNGGSISCQYSHTH